MRRRAITLMLVVSVLMPAGAHAANTAIRPPTLLWKTYPLEQRPAKAQQAPAVPAVSATPARRQAPPVTRPPVTRSRSVTTGQTGYSVRQAAPVQSGESTQLRNTLVLGLLIAALAATSAIVLLRVSVPVPIGGSRRSRGRPARRPPQTSPRRPPQTPPPATRSSDDLLEVLRPNLPDPPAPVEPHPHAVVHEAVVTAQVCEIKLWRGFAKCRLYAALGGSDEALVASPYFRLRDERTPTPEAERALADLLATLDDEGWTVVSEGPGWYRHWLDRLDT